MTPAWDEIIGPVRRAHFGHNAVWVRGGLGLWDDAAHAPSERVLPLVRALRPGVLRFPGGTRAMRYHFDETIGPVDRRLPQCDPFTGVPDATHYGLDEHMQIAAIVDAEVTLVSPWVDGTPEEAAALVAYANATPDSTVTIGTDENGKDWKTAAHWARRRAEHGHPEPYRAAYLEIGNEQYLKLRTPPKTSCGRPAPFRQCERWVRGAPVPTTAENHAEGVALTGRLVRAVDPHIRIGASARADCDGHVDAGADEWNRRLVEVAHDSFDFFVLHPYILPELWTGNARAPQDAVALASGLRKAIHELRAAAPGKGIAITEFGSYTDGDTMGSALLAGEIVRLGIEEQVVMTLRHLLIEDEPSGLFASSAAILGPDLTRTPAYHAMRLLATELEAIAVSTTTTHADCVVLATRDAAKSKLAVVVIDRGAAKATRSVSVTLPAGRWSGSRRTLHGASPMSRAEETKLDTADVEASGALALATPGSSLTFVVLTAMADTA